jgi:uncharacterized protein
MLMIDGIGIDVEARDAQIIQRYLDNQDKKAKDQGGEIDNLKAQIAELQAKLAAAMKSAGAQDGEIAVLKQKVADSTITPALLDKALETRMDVVDRATMFFGDAQKYVWQGKSDAQIRRDVVTARLGDAKAKLLNDDAIEGAFLSLTETGTNDGLTRVAQSFSGAPASVRYNDTAARAYDKRNERLESAYKRNRKPFGQTAN